MKIHKSHLLIRWFSPLLIRNYMLWLWLGMGGIALLSEAVSHKVNNNYFVFTHVYFHLIHQQPLYIPYPHEYADVNLYGPLFSLIIAPFAIMPIPVGVVLWVIANILFLYAAVKQLPLSHEHQQFVMLFSAMELLMNAQWLQFNAFIAACLLLSFVHFRHDKQHLAALWIILGSFTKLYGITGLAFLLFSRKPMKAILWLMIWGAIAFVLPMLLSSPEYILSSYQQWFHALITKNAKNMVASLNNYYQDISVMGLIKRIGNIHAAIDGWVILTGCLLMLISYLPVIRFRFHSSFQWLWLSNILLFTVLFSTGSESPTYIIAVLGVAIWYVTYGAEKHRKLAEGLLIFTFFITSIASTDLVTPWVRIYITRHFALKALPCLLVWIMIIFDLMTGFVKSMWIKPTVPEKNLSIFSS